MKVESGQILLGKYRIDTVLGTGGMGMVVKAHHLHLDEPVAIKFLRSEMLGEANIVKRFMREAQAAVKLKNEHVCRILDFGILDDGAPYIVMEYMRGVDLSELLKTRGRLSPGLAVDYVLQACEALAEAHKAGIIHRDLKTSNLFITSRSDGSPIIKILDFGVSKVRSDINDEITHTNTILGTPAYMSPEQMRSAKEVDERTDIWALGVVLYEFLNGRRPFHGRAFTELCFQVIGSPTPSMDISISPGLEQAVARALCKHPEDRYTNMAEFAAAIAPFAASSTVATSTVERATRMLDQTDISVSYRAESPKQGHATSPPSTMGQGAGQIAARSVTTQRSWLIVAVVAMIFTGVGLFTIVSHTWDSFNKSVPAKATQLPDTYRKLDDITSSTQNPVTVTDEATAPSTQIPMLDASLEISSDKSFEQDDPAVESAGQNGTASNAEPTKSRNRRKRSSSQGKNRATKQEEPATHSDTKEPSSQQPIQSHHDHQGILDSRI